MGLIVLTTVLGVDVKLYLVTGDAQTQPGPAGWRLLTGPQVDHSSLLKLKFKNRRFADIQFVASSKCNS